MLVNYLVHIPCKEVLLSHSRNSWERNTLALLSQKPIKVVNLFPEPLQPALWVVRIWLDTVVIQRIWLVSVLAFWVSF